MRPLEWRIFILLGAAIMLIVGGIYFNPPGTPWHWQSMPAPLIWRGVGCAAATGVCVVLGLLAVRRELIRRQEKLLGFVQHLIADTNPVASDNAALAAPDPLLEPITTSLRQRLHQQQDQIDQLQLQRKDLQIQLRLADVQRRQGETMLHGISDAVIVTNVFNEMILANPAAAELFHFDLATDLRRPIVQVIAHEKLAQEICDTRQMQRKANRRTLEFELESGGQARLFSVTFSAVTDNQGDVSSVVTVLHDVTRDREVAKMKSDFVSHVSHELRTPLSSIKAYAELLVDGEATDDKTRQEFYHIIQGEADRLGRLIDNILNISRIEAGVVRISRKPVPLTGILKEVLEVAMPSAREKQITLNAQLSPVFFQVEVDRDMIYQASLNLVANAVKYTPAGGNVTVRTSVLEDQHQVKVEVIDTGVGIPPEAMSHLFEKFFRVEQNKNMAKGSGLGLHLTRQIIEVVHKGTMIVSSEAGKGSTFGFTLRMVE